MLGVDQAPDEALTVAFVMGVVKGFTRQNVDEGP
jgi:hypothetical protein